MSEWINVDERLPEKDTPVLICLQGINGIFRWEMDFISSSPDYLGKFLFEYFKMGRVTHWIPLPSLPEEPCYDDKKREPEGFFEGIADDCDK